MWNKPPDLLAISEMKIDTNTSDDDEIDIERYKVYRNDCLTDGGGGVAIYIRKDPNMIDLQY